MSSIGENKFDEIVREIERLRRIESAAFDVLFTWDNCGSGSYEDYARSKKAHELLRNELRVAAARKEPT